jgi:hypothetical protein
MTNLFSNSGVNHAPVMKHIRFTITQFSIGPDGMIETLPLPDVHIGHLSQSPVGSGGMKSAYKVSLEHFLGIVVLTLSSASIMNTSLQSDTTASTP